MDGVSDKSKRISNNERRCVKYKATLRDMGGRGQGGRKQREVGKWGIVGDELKEEKEPG